MFVLSGEILSVTNSNKKQEASGAGQASNLKNRAFKTITLLWISISIGRRVGSLYKTYSCSLNWKFSWAHSLWNPILSWLRENNLKLVREVNVTEYYLTTEKKENRNICSRTTNQMIVIRQVLFFLRQTYHFYLQNLFDIVVHWLVIANHISEVTNSLALPLSLH